MLENLRAEAGEFTQWLKQNTNISNNTLGQYASYARRFAHEYTRTLNKEDIKLDSFANLFLREHQYKNYKAAIKLYLKFKGVSTDSLIKTKESNSVSANHTNKTVLTLDEIKLIKENSSLEDALFIEFLSTTAYRCKEGLELKVKYINPDGVVGIVTKGRVFREVLLTNNLKQKFLGLIEREGLSPNDYIFFNNQNSKPKVKRIRFYERINEVSKKVLNKKIGTHDFRRFAATTFYLKSGHDLKLLNMWLCHKDINTTERYIRHLTMGEVHQKAKDIFNDVF
jgi:integrase